MSDVTLTVGDRLPGLTRTFLLDDAVVDLTGYTVTFDMWNAATGVQKVTDGSASISGAATDGTVQYLWADGDVDTAGRYLARFKATISGRTLTAPNQGFIVIEIGARATASNGASYTGNPADRPIDTVRFLLGDTDVTAAVLTDAEISWLLSEHADDAYMAAAAGADNLAATAVQNDVQSKSVGGLSITYDGRQQQHWTDLAKTIRARRFSLGGVVPKLASTGDDVVEKQFKVGMHDFGQAGLVPWDATKYPRN